MVTDILQQISYGVYVVSARDKDKPTGCIANSVMQITSSPAIIAVSMHHDNHTHAVIRQSGKFAVSVLAEDSDPAIIGTFGFRSGRDTDKFAQVNSRTVEDVAVVEDACGYFVCEVVGQTETPTHTIFLGAVQKSELFGNRTPMTYAYYHAVIKGKSPKNAPTYVPAATESAKGPQAKRKFQCSVCGYVYEGEELPEDFVCPVCGVLSTRFSEI